MSFVKLLNVNVPTLQGHKRLLSEKAQILKVTGRGHTGEPRYSGDLQRTDEHRYRHAFFCESTSAAPTRAPTATINYLVENLEVRRKFKKKEKKIQAAQLVFFHLALLSHGRRPGAESFQLISADKCTAYSEQEGGLGQVSQKGQRV